MRSSLTTCWPPSSVPALLCMMERSSSRKTVSRPRPVFFRHNLGLKFISLALAIGLWQVVRHDPVGEIALDVPIEFRNLPENMEISTENIPRAEIRLRGPERLLRNLSRADVHANVDV